MRGTKMEKFTKSFFTCFAVTVFAFSSGCDFTAPNKTYQGENKVRFVSATQALTAFEPSDVKTIQVSHLVAQTNDVQYTFSVVTEESSAIEGVHYNLPSKSVTISANEYIGTFSIELIQQELAEPKTLILQLEGNSLISNRAISLDMVAFFEFERENFLGAWILEYPWFYGPGEFNVTAVEGSAENSIIIPGMLDGTDIEIFLDDSNPENFVATVPETPNVWAHSAGMVYVEGTGTFTTVTGQEKVQVSLFHFIPGVGNFGAPSPFTLSKP